jgi:hypothetical protein
MDARQLIPFVQQAVDAAAAVFYDMIEEHGIDEKFEVTIKLKRKKGGPIEDDVVIKT